MAKSKREAPKKRKPTSSKTTKVLDAQHLAEVDVVGCPYKPLAVVVVTAFFFSISHNHNQENTHTMGFFMGYFLCMLAMFQAFDHKGFIKGFRKYDIISSYCPGYANFYPLIEFALGFSMLMAWMPFITNFLILVISLFGAVSVMRTMQLKDKLDCACLGTSFTLPLGMVSLVEYSAMAIMAFLNIITL